MLRQQKVNRLAVFVDSTVQIASLALHLNIRFIDVIVTTPKSLALVFQTQVYKLTLIGSRALAAYDDVDGSSAANNRL